MYRFLEHVICDKGMELLFFRLDLLGSQLIHFDVKTSGPTPLFYIECDRVYFLPSGHAFQTYTAWFSGSVGGL